MGVPTPTITSAKKPMDAAFGIVSIDIVKVADKIPSARIVLLDGSSAKQEFTVSNDTFFEPGKEIEIKLRYEDTSGSSGSDQTVFKGIVVKHGVKAGRKNATLIIDMKDKAIGLTTLRKSAVFTDKSDKDILSGILKNAPTKAKPTVKKIDMPTSLFTGSLKSPAEMIQYYSTDWDFILSRADANGCRVFLSDGEISILKIELSGSAAKDHTFEYGIDKILDFEMEADITKQYKSIGATAWDIAQQKASAAKKASAFTIKQGNLKADDGAKAVCGDDDSFFLPVDITPEEIENLANGKMMRTRVAMLKGRMRIPGNALIKIGEIIEIKGISKRFNGTTMVTGIRHRYSTMGWHTDVQFGISAERFARKSGITDVPAAGLLPAIHGLHVGIVDKFEEDKDKKYRVRVKIPGVFEAKKTTEGPVWARLASMDSGKGRGFFFRPEEGDEVILGFLNNDPRQPVILGSMYSAKNIPPVAAEDIKKENFKKGIFTKEKFEIAIDEEIKEMTIATPGGNFITLTENTEGDKAGIIWTDQNKNIVKSNKNGITIQTKKDIIIKGANITVEGTGDVVIKGSAIDMN